MIACDVSMFPDQSKSDERMIDEFFHECYYMFSAVCDDGTVITCPVGHYSDTMRMFENVKYAVYSMGGGKVSLFRIWDRDIDDEDEFEMTLECEWVVYDDQDNDEEMMIII